jgi:2-polyprenyl-3-methyl-5-hydroxy-6-metoxy-1,4-benzoquinol methylase
MPMHEKSHNGSFVCSWRVKQLLDGYRSEMPAGSRVLDIGCGNGTMAETVAKEFGVKMEGADITNMLTADIPFHQLPESWSAWQGGSFDIIMINDALHHMPPEIQIATLRDSLRVGKKVLIFDTCPTLVAKIADLIMGGAVYRGKEEIPLTHKNPTEWRQILEKLGAQVKEIPVSKPFLFYPLKHFVLVTTNKD